ncbi:DUF6192 family protein [Streptomyces sp. NPDC056352]|uniref:DUF6192 family protein n=1 Tax=Streptomyces sp. NPDC056352 TaxID=3345791 RepID=UPI0035D77B7A
MAKGTDDLFTVEDSVQMLADDTRVARSRWRTGWTASCWPQAQRKGRISFTVHKTLASVQDEHERSAAIQDEPFNMRSSTR